ncbi:MAG: TetR/AcrR family transcriptional regulator [Erysipelotrichaceae bacterium]|nr:TetR/AcrR family transcriptional regulator [Erysipelotrichaceae bacterium]
MNPNSVEINRVTKESIAIAAVELLESGQGLSITSICNKAGVSRNAYYRNFDTTDDVLIYYLVMKWKEYADSNKVDKEPKDRIGIHLVRFCYSQQDFLRTLKKLGQIQLIEKLFLSIAVPNEVDGALRYFLYSTSYLIYGFIRAMVDNDFSDTPEEIERMLEEFKDKKQLEDWIR